MRTKSADYLVRNIHPDTLVAITYTVIALKSRLRDLELEDFQFNQAVQHSIRMEAALNIIDTATLCNWLDSPSEPRAHDLRQRTHTLLAPRRLEIEVKFWYSMVWVLRGRPSLLT